jgi:hypothetical protein
VHAKEISEILVSKLQQQLQVMSLESTAASSSAKLEKQMLGDVENSSIRSSSTQQNDADSALAGLWGGSNAAAARVRDSGDGDRQLRSFKSSVPVLQIELAEARLQSQRSAESEERLRGQLQRVMSENDAALVMLGQVCCSCTCTRALTLWFCLVTGAFSARRGARAFSAGV